MEKAHLESGQIQIKGLIIQDDCSTVNPGSLLRELIENDVPVLSGADTRAIVKRIKYAGEMPAVLTRNKKCGLLPTLGEEEPERTKQMKTIIQKGKSHIAVIDFGYKRSLISVLQKYGCKVTIVPCFATKQQMDELNPDGVIFSGGWGNPLSWGPYFDEYKKIAISRPVVAFGLGHQILALSFGIPVEKMRTGHRSFKEPVIDAATQKVYMSVQNHGYAVQDKQMNKCGWRISFQNVHDGTVEGLVHERHPIATYQFHPDLYENPLNDAIFEPFFQHVSESKGASVYA
jgi:carbamoyl-phosphate synthase small subunit